MIETPRFTNNDEACDIVIKEGSRLVIIEIKASILTARAKYSFDPDVLRDELLRKAIRGEEGEPKGIAQLRRTVERFPAGETISDVATGDVTVIYPVLVFLDKSFTSPYLSTLYREGFDRATLGRRPLVTSPFAITVADLEGILPCTQAHGVAEILEEYYRCNRTASGDITFGRLADANIPLLRNVERGRDIVRERFARFNDDLIKISSHQNMHNVGMEEPDMRQILAHNLEGTAGRLDVPVASQICDYFLASQVPGTKSA